jgi:outer membrane murein-binding lipoprotein Lpp
VCSRLDRNEKVQKRASNVLKLSQEHEKLKEELRAMTERLEAAERRQKEYMARKRTGIRGGNSN